MLWIVLGVIALLLVLLVLLYNRLVTLRNRVDNAWAQVDVQLKRRYDLIPNLVETVKGYAAHERETFEAVTNARARAQAAQGPAEQGAAEGILSQALGRLFAVAEAYPELQADENFRQLQDGARDDGEPDRRLAPGLQRHRPDVQQRDPDRAGRLLRRARSASPRRTSSRSRKERGRRHASRSRARVSSRGARRGARLRRTTQPPSPSRCPSRGRRRPGRRRREPDRRRGHHVRLPPATSAAPSARSRSDDGESIDRGRGVGGRPPLPSPARRPSWAPRVRPDTFGTTQTDKGLRIVWHYQASNEDAHVPHPLPAARRRDGLRRHRRRQPQGLGRRVGDRARPPDRRRCSRPADIERAWGHPVHVRGDVTLDGRRATLRALDIPAGQFVELRALIPRRAFTSTAGMKVEEGLGLEKIVAEEQADAAAYERDRKKIDDALDDPLRTLAILLALALLPALAVDRARLVAATAESAGRAYDREYEQEPPTDTEPALVPPLLAQGGTAGSLEFTATLFDLIRRGRYKADPVTTERKIWAGLRTQQVADLELSLADVEKPIEGFEAPVAEVVDGLVADRPGAALALPRPDRGQPRGELEALHRRSRKRSGARSRAATGSGTRASCCCSAAPSLLRRDRRDPALRRHPDVRLRRADVAERRADRARRLRPRQHRRARRGARSTAGSGGAARRRRRPRRSAGRPSAATSPTSRASTSRRAATLELWERYLVYGIAFGIAERVLQGAQLHMPEALAQASNLYWIGPHGDLALRARRRSGSATSRRASARRSRLPRRARAASAAASPAAAEAAGAEAEAAPGEGAPRCSRSRSCSAALPPAAAATTRAAGTTERRRRRHRAAGLRPGPARAPLENGQAAEMLVTPGGERRERARGRPPRRRRHARERARGVPRRVGRARARARRTGLEGRRRGACLRSEQDLDLESVNSALAEAYDRCEIDRQRVAVGGFSDGGDLRALARALERRPLPGDHGALTRAESSAASQVGVPRVFVSHGTLDTVLPIERAGDAVVKQLRAAGYPVEYRRSAAATRHRTRRRRRQGRTSAGSSTRATRLAPRALVERDRAGDGDVERLGRARQRDRRDIVA